MHDNRKMKILSNIMLILAAAIWGSNFIFQKTAATEIGPFLFMACRSIPVSYTHLDVYKRQILRRMQEPKHGERKDFSQYGRKQKNTTDKHQKCG